MTKKINRKLKWRNITLNKANIDEYLLDLYNDTSGNYITQGVSFNKDDNYQMTLLRNALIAHGSFSGFIKNLLHTHFEQNGKLDETIWQPNDITEVEMIEENSVNSPPSVEESTTENSSTEEVSEQTEKNIEQQQPKRNRTESNVKDPDKKVTTNAKRVNNYSL